MTAKTEELYKRVLERLVAYIPEFKPVATMSNWEQASRNAFFHKFAYMGVSFTILNEFGQRFKNLVLLTISKLTQKFPSSPIC